MADELVTIQVRLSGGKKAAAEAKVVGTEIKGVGTATAEAGAMSSTAGSRIGRTVGRLRGVWTAVGRIAKGAAFALAGAAAAVVLWGRNAVQSTEDLAKTTSGLNKNLGLSVERASAWAAVASSRGLDNTKLSMAMKSLASQAVAASQGTASATEMFDKLGFSQGDLKRSMTDTNFLLEKTADGLHNLPPGVERTTYAAKLLGRGWKDLTPLLREGSEELNSQLNLAKESGATFSKNGVEGVMDMIKADRELALANTGLQISFTRIVGPAIIKISDEVKKFASILNDPKLSAEQKQRLLTKQFEGLVLTLQHIIEKAAPVLAQAAAHAGFAMFRALVAAFFHASFVGKLVIGGLIWKMLGGKGVVAVGTKLAGTTMGRWFGTAVVAGILAYGIWQQLSAKSKAAVIEWAGNAAVDFTNFFIKTLNERIHEINNIFNTANPFGDLPFGASVAAPQIPEIGEQGSVKVSPDAFQSPMGKGTAPGANWEVLGTPPPGKTAPKHHGNKSPRPRERMKPSASHPSARSRGQGVRQPIVLTVDGKTLAETVVQVTDDAAARR